MKHTKKIILIMVCAWLLLAVIPIKTTALYSNSFDQVVSQYFFLKCTSRNNDTTAVTHFTIPPLNMNWMIEVTSLINGPPNDTLKGKVYYENTSETLNRWHPTALFGSSEITFGLYNNVTGYYIDPTFEQKFPVPFIVPTNMTTVYNQALNVSLSTHFQYYMFQNLTGMVPPPFSSFLSLQGLVVAWNGTPWMNGTMPGDTMLVAIYLGNGELTYLRESWWDNSTPQWRTMYKLVTPMWELIGGMFEGMLPGSDVTGGGMGIPGFEYALVFLGLIITIGAIYLKKPKNSILI